MLRFEPSELRDEFTKTLKDWAKRFEFSEVDLSEDCGFIMDLMSESFDPSEYEDITIDKNHLLGIEIPRWHGTAYFSYTQLVDLLEELEGAKLYENKICKTSKRFLIRVEAVNETAIRFLYHSIPEAEKIEEEATRNEIVEVREKISNLSNQLDKLDVYGSARDEVFKEWTAARNREQELFQEMQKSTDRFCVHRFVFDNSEICCSLTQGFSIFGILIAQAGEYDKYFPPILDDDLFVEIRFSKNLPEEHIQNIFEAYLFELSSSLEIHFQPSPRPYLDGSWLDKRCDYVIKPSRFRPLVLGKGTTELLRLYNKAVASQDLDVQILYFTKAIEYVSQTVIRIQSHEAIRGKLLSSKALEPDAMYISELEAVFEAQRVYKKDREAIRQTIAVCCEASELAKVAPIFIKEFKRISVESSLQDKIKALEALGRILYTTRNEIAHAKANYTSTGDECPPEQLHEFTQCVKIATQQVIRWYHFRPESIRLA